MDAIASLSSDADIDVDVSTMAKINALIKNGMGTRELLLRIIALSPAKVTEEKKSKLMHKITTHPRLIRKATQALSKVGRDLNLA